MEGGGGGGRGEERGGPGGGEGVGQRGGTRPVAGTWLDRHASCKEGRVISGIGKVVVPVDDQERAKEFWTQRMGLADAATSPTATSAGLR